MKSMLPPRRRHAAVLPALLAFLAGRLAAAEVAAPQVGLQLYSLRDQFARDVRGTLDKVKGLGVRNVELAGTYGLSAAAFKAELDARGLRAVSAHFDYARLRDDIDGVVRDAKTLGLEYVGGGWIPHDDKRPFDEATMRAAIAVFNKAGEALARQGLKFFLHTHGYEFQPRRQGTLFDLLMAETRPEFVKLQMDVFWIVHAGQDPVKLLETYGSRWQLIHLKGMKESTPTGLFTGHSAVTNDVPLGTGKIDYVPILRAARAVGVRWYIIEDESPAAEQQIPQSLRYLVAALGVPSAAPSGASAPGVAPAGAALAGAPAAGASPATAARAAGLGIFTAQADVGDVKKAGSVIVDAVKGTYLVAGGGENMWHTSDAFHFVWREASGDLSFAAGIAWLGTSAEPHRKACLILRQSLAPDAPYADVVLHGDGPREPAVSRDGGGTDARDSVESRGASAAGHREARRLRVDARRGARAGAARGRRLVSHSAEGAVLRRPRRIGARQGCPGAGGVFEGGAVGVAPSAAGASPRVESTLETVMIASMDRRVVYQTPDHIEAPNWSRDGQYLLFNSGGRIYRLPVPGGRPQLVDTGPATRCNNDHGISPDGRTLVVSDQSEPGNRSRIYLLPIAGGVPRQVTPLAPSYWHGWSPDGATLAYCAERAGQFDVYTIPVVGGAERRLTTAAGLDDGPDYSPDGKSIYFNSERTGRMQIWRMSSDGSDQEQVTSDEFNNWFPHPSPDGKQLVFLSYPKDVKGHPENKDVMLRLMPLGGGEIRVLARLFGGQGTLNVPSWSPDSQRVAFVSYQPTYP